MTAASNVHWRKVYLNQMKSLCSYSVQGDGKVATCNCTSSQNKEACAIIPEDVFYSSVSSMINSIACLSFPPDELSLLCSAVPGQFQLEPLNSTVLQGSDVRFNATVQGIWRIMTWHVGGLLVLTVPISGDITSSSKLFSARFCFSSDTTCVEFTIHNVTRRESGPVICIVQGEYGSKTAQLQVQGKVITIYQAAVVYV